MSQDRGRWLLPASPDTTTRRKYDHKVAQLGPPLTKGGMLKRWHEETHLMFGRWKQEMDKHGYDWRNPPDPKCDRDACHCAAGIGSLRKKKPFDCGRPKCGVCHFEKFYCRKDRANEVREAIKFEVLAY